LSIIDFKTPTFQQYCRFYKGRLHLYWTRPKILSLFFST